ncbi:unnamed protein product [Caenorhabditis auriculariae]|uniref:HAP1 N-terminal domain-containing protein n=1 Tax=Caenorhabditis auriculariae TaxID=2777116 RepID=A0A8S1GYM4_9PELO|nr:unnamed protein product [Caenorhabditis auriculariae]
MRKKSVATARWMGVGGATTPSAASVAATSSSSSASAASAVAGVFRDVDDYEDLLQKLAKNESDLELAAKIGQSLLEQNKDYQNRNDFLEESLAKTTDTVIQLKHQLQQKIDLLRVYSHLDDDGLPRHNSDDSLRVRLDSARHENERLRREFESLKLQKDLSVAEERQNAEELCRQLDDANDKVHKLQRQIEGKSVELQNQSETVERLLREVQTKEGRERELFTQREELSSMLIDMITKNDAMSDELGRMQEQYAELKGTFKDAEEELLRLRQSGAFRAASFDSLYDSLASELENSDSGMSSSRVASAMTNNNKNENGGFLTARSCGGALHVAHAQPLSLELEMVASQSCDPSDRLSGVGLEYKPIVEPKELCDASTSCTDIFVESTSFETPTPVATSTPNNIDKGSLKLELTKPTSIDCAPSTAATPEVAPPIAAIAAVEPSTSSATPKRLTVNRLRLKMPAKATTPKRTGSQDSLDGYDAPKLGQPGVPGTRDLDFSLKNLKARQQTTTTVMMHGVVACEDEGKEKLSSWLSSSSSSSACCASSSSPPCSSTAGFPARRFILYTPQKPTRSTPTTTSSWLKSGKGKKSSLTSCWTDFSVSFGMRGITSSFTQPESLGIMGMNAKPLGVLTRAEMISSPSTSPQHRPLSLSLSDAERRLLFRVLGKKLTANGCTCQFN